MPSPACCLGQHSQHITTCRVHASGSLRPRFWWAWASPARHAWGSLLSKSAWTVMQVQDRVQVLGRVMIRRAPRAGQDAGIAAEASRFLQISAPSLLLNAVSTCIRNHLLAQLDVVVASRARLAPCMGPSIPAVCMRSPGAWGDRHTQVVA